MPMTGRRLNPDGVNPYRDLDTTTERQLAAVKRFLRGAALAAGAAEAFERAGQKGG